MTSAPVRMVTDRLNQGPFPQYPPDAVIPTDDVVMTTTPSEDVVPNYGKGLVTYITADSGTEEIKSDNIPQAIEELVQFPAGRAALHPPDLAGSTAAAWPAGAARLCEAGFCIGEDPQQAGRIPGADVRSRLYTRSGPAGFCPRQSAESGPGA